MPLFNNNKRTVEEQNLAATGNVAGTRHGHTAGTRQGHGTMNQANVNLPGPAPYTAGPHSSDFLNKLDPTVDSQSGGMQVLAPGAQTATGVHRASGGVPPIPTGTDAASHAPAVGVQPGMGLHSNNPYGGVQHNSRLANELDPRVDATQANMNTGNYTTYAGGPGTRLGGTTAAPRNVPEGTYGPHSSRMANAADPRIDSDADHRARVGVNQSTHTSAFPPGVGGPAPNTAGPHRKDILNKLDPSVDSKPTGLHAGVDATGRRY